MKNKTPTDNSYCTLSLYEILIPSYMGGRKISLKYHRVWDKFVKDISGGLTILYKTQGQWKSPEGTHHNEEMIPVRIACTKEEIERIAENALIYYDQRVIMYYKISDEVCFVGKENV